MRHFFTLIFCLSVVSGSRAEVEITPSDVYGQVLLIERETERVRRFVNPASHPGAWQPVRMDIQPRHVWQKAYMVQIKIVAFRQSRGMVDVTPVLIAPRRDIDPRLNWAQMQRLLTEIRFIREKMLGIPGEVDAAPRVGGKTAMDVFNKLSEIELQWADLAGYPDGNPSLNFAQALRLDEDVGALMRVLNVFDNAIPPAKQPAARPDDALAKAFQVLEQVQRLQRLAGFETVDFAPLRRTEEATSSHVFNLIGLTLAELQPVKARLGLIHVITPPASFQENRTSADVMQLLGYVADKLRLIQHL